jgi:hypothetical protein
MLNAWRCDAWDDASVEYQALLASTFFALDNWCRALGHAGHDFGLLVLAVLEMIIWWTQG